MSKKPLTRPTIQVDKDGDDTMLEKRQDSLLPGQVRTPNFTVERIDDWSIQARSIWEEEEEATRPKELKRDSSLLPGQVRTPNFTVDAVDWAAPGSSVWEEDGTHSAKSHHTPLAPYGSGLWVTEEEEHAAVGGPGDANQARQAFSHEDLSTPLSPFSTNAKVAANTTYTTIPSSFEVRSHPEGGDPVDHAGRQQRRAIELTKDEVELRLIGSAGLPLALCITNGDLQEYIHHGQPNLGLNGTVAGTTDYPRNFPNLSEPPEDRQVHVHVQGRMQYGVPMSYPEGGPQSGGDSGNYHLPDVREKSNSELLSDLLHFHANYFPPPPPPRVPLEERRTRAELWYHYASKWDITHRLPPPPRTPLPEMQMEYLQGLPQKTKVPYHGDGWLQMAERWFAVVQRLFDYPVENSGCATDLQTVLQNAVTS